MIKSVLILVLISPTGSGGLTSQSIGGFNTPQRCEIAAIEARIQKFVVAAFCIKGTE